MGVGQVSSPWPSRDSNDGENGSVNLWNLASTRSGCTLATHIGDRNREIKPLPVRESVPTAIMPVLFTPMFAPVRGMRRRWLVENKSCCAETNEGENGEKAENPVGQDIHTAQRHCVVTKLGEESAGIHYNI